MEIELIGNSAYYQVSHEVFRRDFHLIGSPNGTMTFQAGTEIYSFKDPNAFYTFIERLKGTSPSNIPLLLSEFNLVNYIVALQIFARKSVTEINLFKSVFLIYDWVEIAYRDHSTFDLASKIYNEFIVDVNNIPGPQEDIYFIKRDLMNETNVSLLQRLIDINLLVQAKFTGGGAGAYTSYFIPLDKPGVPREYFRHKADPSGEKTYNLWKQILFDRDNRISTWFNKRF